jgi:hypothetical protein
MILKSKKSKVNYNLFNYIEFANLIGTRLCGTVPKFV